MAGTTPFFILSLTVLLGASFADASTQEAQLSKFIVSRALKGVANRAAEVPGETDLWADPSNFAHLPGRCKVPPSGRKEADRVAALPGQPPRVNFRQYAGYVKVDEEHCRELFYYFVESPYDAASKPLILWLNGGPGCSSLGYGAMEELGPFRVNPDGKTLGRNRHAWTNLANVIFLESPAGVGFSFSRNATDYTTVGDRRTAEDAYVFLVKWFERFPEYKGREFYVSGESYGGHYVPELATVIAAMNSFPGQQTPINLQGIFFGNPYLDIILNNKGTMEYFWSHGVISDEVWATFLANCHFNASDDIACSVPSHWFDAGEISGYDIYAPACLQSSNFTFYPSTSSYLPGYDACIDHYVFAYLNNLKCKRLCTPASTRTGYFASDLRMYSVWKDAPVQMAPIIKRLIDRGLRVWIYSGDFDSKCPLTATRYSVKDLNLTVTDKWRPWYTPDREVGGYVQRYGGGFTLASVRGAGHMVPSFQPKRSLALLYSFLKNMLPPAGIPN